MNYEDILKKLSESIFSIATIEHNMRRNEAARVKEQLHGLIGLMTPVYCGDFLGRDLNDIQDLVDDLQSQIASIIGRAAKSGAAKGNE